jgi:hypothetical protein
MSEVVMTTFGTQQWLDDQKPKGLPVLLVPRYPRKDGKFAVTFVFTARSIRSIITVEKLEAYKASGGYEVRAV